MNPHARRRGSAPHKQQCARTFVRSSGAVGYPGFQCHGVPVASALPREIITPYHRRIHSSSTCDGTPHARVRMLCMPCSMLMLFLFPEVLRFSFCSIALGRWDVRQYVGVICALQAMHTEFLTTMCIVFCSRMLRTHHGEVVD